VSYLKVLRYNINQGLKWFWMCSKNYHVLYDDIIICSIKFSWRRNEQMVYDN